MNFKELNHSTLELTVDDILIIRCKEDYQFELQDVQEILLISGEITNGKKVPTLTIPGKYSQATKEALEFIFSPEATLYSSHDAFIAQSLSQKIVGNFYLKLKKPNIPTRLFTNEKLAIEWLMKKSKSKVPDKPN